MKHFKNIKKIARMEYDLIFEVLPPTQQDQLHDFFTFACTELSLIFPPHFDTFTQYATPEHTDVYQKKRMTAFLEKIQVYSSQLPPALWQSCLSILRDYVNSRDFGGVMRYQQKWVFWGIYRVVPTTALMMFNQGLQALEKKDQRQELSIGKQATGQFLPTMPIRQVTLTLLSLHTRYTTAETTEKSALTGKISLHIVHPTYGPTRWLYPCGTLHFSEAELMEDDEILMPPSKRDHAIQPLLLSQDELASDPQEGLITKISDYYEGLLQVIGVWEIAGQYGIHFRSMMKKYYPLFVYEVMAEEGWENPWGITNFQQYLQEVLKGCRDWPQPVAAEEDFRQFTLSVSREKFLMLWKNIIDKEEDMLKEEYRNQFGEGQAVQEQWKNIFFRKDNTTISILNSALAQICELNIRHQQKSIPLFVEQLREEYRKNQLLYGQDIENAQLYAQKTLQRVTKTSLGKLAQDCHALKSGSILFMPPQTWESRRRYDAEKHIITVNQDDAFSRLIWETTPPWLVLFDGILPRSTSDQMLLEGFIQSLCHFMATQLTPGRQSLPYWDKSQQQQWITARKQDTAYLGRLSYIVSAILQGKKLKKRERAVWNQLKSQVTALYRDNRFRWVESPHKRHVRHLKSLGISLEEIKNQSEEYYQYNLYSPIKMILAGEEIEFAETYQKAYQLEWVQTHSSCDNQSLAWSTLKPPRKFDFNEMTISAFLCVYHRIVKAELVSSVEFLGGYGQALMALGGQEELVALFVPNLHRYIQEILLPMGNKICRGIHSDQLSESVEPDHSIPEPVVIPPRPADSFRIPLGIMAGLLVLFSLAWILRHLLNKKNPKKKSQPVVLLNKSEKIVKQSPQNWVTPLPSEEKQRNLSLSPTVSDPPLQSVISDPKIRLRKVKTTTTEKRTTIVQLIESKYPHSVQNTNSIFIKTTASLTEVRALLTALPGVTTLKPSKNKENLLIEFTDGIFISIAQAHKKPDKPMSRLKLIRTDCTQKIQPKSKDDSPAPEKKPRQMEVIFSGDITKLHLSAAVVAKQLTLATPMKIIRCTERVFQASTGQAYDFSQPQDMAYILLTKFIQLSYMIKTTAPEIHVEAYGGILLSLMLGNPLQDLDMILRVPAEFNGIVELFESLKQRKLIAGYRKSAKKNKELFIVDFCNSLVDMRIARLAFERDSQFLDYTCNTFSLEIEFDPPKAKIHATPSGRKFLTALKQGETPTIEAVINPDDGHWLIQETVKSSVIEMVKNVFLEYEESQIHTVIADVIQSSQSALICPSVLSRFILTLLAYIQDPERIFRLFILYRKTGYPVSPDLSVIVEKLIPFLFHTALTVRKTADEKEKSPLNREDLFFYFKKYVIKNFHYFGTLLPDDLNLFQAVILAGVERSKIQRTAIDTLFSSACLQFASINRYLFENLMWLQESKNNHLVIDLFLMAITHVQMPPIMLSRAASSPEFKKKLEENNHLLGYTRPIEQWRGQTPMKEMKQPSETKKSDVHDRQIIHPPSRYSLLPMPLERNGIQTPIKSPQSLQLTPVI